MTCQPTSEDPQLRGVHNGEVRDGSNQPRFSKGWTFQNVVLQVSRISTWAIKSYGHNYYGEYGLVWPHHGHSATFLATTAPHPNVFKAIDAWHETPSRIQGWVDKCQSMNEHFTSFDSPQFFPRSQLVQRHQKATMTSIANCIKDCGGMIQRSSWADDLSVLKSKIV